MADQINPSHYKGFSNGAEVVDIAERLNFNRGNAIKYLARAGRKEGQATITDLEKAKWYLEREIARIVSDGKEVSPTPPAPSGPQTLKVHIVLELVVCDRCAIAFGVPLELDNQHFLCPRGHGNAPRKFEAADGTD
ncbi:hypothetical protein BCA37_10610 [Mycobacterium sp. djl-10]|nr:hypothetical protein BCA37_10610 [Mycobacterium sp. djl-10]